MSTLKLATLTALSVAFSCLISCNKDELNDLNAKLDKLEDQLDSVKTANNILEFKSYVLDKRSAEVLVTGMDGVEEGLNEINFENGESIQVHSDILEEAVFEPAAWDVTFKLTDGSQIKTRYLGDAVVIAASQIHLNPYNNSPLAAEVNVTYPVRGKVKIRVVGQDGVASNIEHTVDAYDYHHDLEVYGLYPDHDNQVEILFLGEDGAERSKSTIVISTEPLPSGFPEFDIVKAYDAAEANTVFLLDYRPSNTPLMVDVFGKVRWYSTGFSVTSKYGLQRFKNGNIGFGRGGKGQGSVFEYSMSGKLIREYSFFPTYESAHHDVFEMYNGNLLVPVDKRGAATVEDYILEIDRNSGAIVKTWNLNTSIPRRNTLIHDEVDWVHVNAVIHDERDNSIIVSGQRQGIYKISYENQLQWILAAPEGWDGWEQYLLTNEDPNFDWIWGQHAPLLTPEGNLMLFDNGFGRGYGSEDDFSRAVEFKINSAAIGGTVELEWEYGRERGAEMYSPIISDVDYLTESGNRLITSGSLSCDNTYVNPDQITTVFTTEPVKARIIEVDKAGSVKFEMTLSGTQVGGSVYRSEKIKIYQD